MRSLISWLVAGLLWACLASGPAWSADRQAAADWTPPPCLDRIAAQLQVNSTLVHALVMVESGGNPLALNVNHNGTGFPQKAQSYDEAAGLIRRLWRQGANFDVGLGQININTAIRHDVHPLWLLDPCWNLYVTTQHLREKIERHGYNWTAIERYNGINPRYPWKVYKQLQRLLGER